MMQCQTTTADPVVRRVLQVLRQNDSLVPVTTCQSGLHLTGG
jgi:hypothetical protein